MFVDDLHASACGHSDSDNDSEGNIEDFTLFSTGDNEIEVTSCNRDVLRAESDTNLITLPDNDIDLNLLTEPDREMTDSEDDMGGVMFYAEELDSEEDAEETADHADPLKEMFNSVNDTEIPEDIGNHWRSNRGQSDMGNESNLHFHRDEEHILNMPNACRSVLAFFKAFFPENMWHTIATETNQYASRRLQAFGSDAFEQTQHANYKPFSRINKWKETDEGELKLFTAHLILMGLTRKPDIESYWAQDNFTRMPFFGKFMSRDRFTAILANLHVADDTTNPKYGQNGHDALAKLRPFVDSLNELFKYRYKPERDLSLDEGCCPFKGRLRFKCYNPSKPNKFHIKLFQISEASSGYVVGFSVYTGQGSCHRDDATVDTTCGVTTKTVMTLADDCGVLDEGRVIYFDNYYSSPELFEELLYRDTLACGTVRSNRKDLPIAVVQAKLKNKDDLIFRRRGDDILGGGGGLLALKWLEKKKPVFMISTAHSASWSFTGKCLRDVDKTPVYKPTVVVEYTRKMGGVDLSDQLMSYYHFLRRSCKWSTKLFLHLLSMSMLNAFVLNRKFGDENKLSHWQYREALAKELVREACQERELVLSLNNRWLAELNPSRLEGRHFLVKIAQTGVRVNPLVCRVCRITRKDQQNGKGANRKRKTVFSCDSCCMPMCIYPCFKLYHTKENYKDAVDLVLS